MAVRAPHTQTILHLVPTNNRAKAVLDHPHNALYVSQCVNGELGLEIGYHVASNPCPEKLVEIGRNADLILPGSSISTIHFSFEVHPESKCIMFYDRSRHFTTRIDPDGFRQDGLFRQVVIQPDQSIKYDIGVGGINKDMYRFTIVWLRPADAPQEVERGYLQAVQRPQNPRWARTFDDTATELSTWYNTRLHTSGDSAVNRYRVCKTLGVGAFATVIKAIDLDSGGFVAVKEIRPSGKYDEGRIMCEAKMLSQLSHKNIVEYLGSRGWGDPPIYLFMAMKHGTATTLFDAEPGLRTSSQVLHSLLHQMLEALDYLSYRNLIHRDVKPDNILYTKGENGHLFQLADFGLSRHAMGAKTFCGTYKYMAPEVFGDGPQTPKMDVWSLLITILDLMQFYSKRLESHDEVLRATERGVKQYPMLAPMGKESVTLRASAGQLLVDLFKGQGLTTPRAKVRTVAGPKEDRVRSSAGQQEGLNHHHRVTKSSHQQDVRQKGFKQLKHAYKARQGADEQLPANLAGHLLYMN